MHDATSKPHCCSFLLYFDGDVVVVIETWGLTLLTAKDFSCLQLSWLVASWDSFSVIWYSVEPVAQLSYDYSPCCSLTSSCYVSGLRWTRRRIDCCRQCGPWRRLAYQWWAAAGSFAWRCLRGWLFCHQSAFVRFLSAKGYCSCHVWPLANLFLFLTFPNEMILNRFD